ncbi:LysR family transcriptional regulator [Azospirillum sp. SYSU D00513]|uniref:LysR family transcriptional regulator n=1 Tax=Azospirillum sp. SYSU D00513 TaxID=2812561 RepID=UPI001A9627A5|nr:LysR family transcriptional regulator [Azospirillum sp. SYSU D00513]
MADFNWNDLRSFLAVARTGKLTAAARRLGADHATVSRRLAALEDSMKVRLFERHPTGYTLTAQGERLLPLAESMESVALTAQNELGNADLSVSGAVRIGSPDGFGSLFLAPRIGALCRQHPELEVQLIATPRIFSLSKREADIAIGLTRPQEGRLLARKLTDYRLRLYGARGYLEEQPEIRGPADLARHRFIGYIDELLFSPELDYMNAVGGIEPQLKSTNLIAQLRATQSGLGLCILPCFIADGEADLLPVLPEEVALTRSFWLIIHEDMRRLARITAAADFITAAVQEARSQFMP